MNVGDRIRERREKIGLTQTELARRLGIDKGTVWRWEAGRTSPQRGQLQRVAAMLGVTPAWLAGSQPEAADAPAHWAEFIEKYPEINLLDDETRIAMQDFAARSGMRIRRWLDWVKLAEVVLQARPSPSHEAKKQARQKNRNS